MNEEQELAELIKAHGSIADFRAKLLGFLPLGSTVAVGILASQTGFSEEFKSSLWLIGLAGLGVTTGLYFFEYHQMRHCTAIIERGVEIEQDLYGVGKGFFSNRPPRMVDAHTAGYLVYGVVAAAWTSLILVFGSSRDDKGVKCASYVGGVFLLVLIAVVVLVGFGRARRDARIAMVDWYATRIVRKIEGESTYRDDLVDLATLLYRGKDVDDDDKTIVNLRRRLTFKGTIVNLRRLTFKLQRRPPPDKEPIEIVRRRIMRSEYASPHRKDLLNILPESNKGSNDTANL